MDRFGPTSLELRNAPCSPTSSIPQARLRRETRNISSILTMSSNEANNIFERTSRENSPEEASLEGMMEYHTEEIPEQPQITLLRRASVSSYGSSYLASSESSDSRNEADEGASLNPHVSTPNSPEFRLEDLFCDEEAYGLEDADKAVESAHDNIHRLELDFNNIFEIRKDQLRVLYNRIRRLEHARRRCDAKWATNKACHCRCNCNVTSGFERRARSFTRQHSVECEYFPHPCILGQFTHQNH